MFQSEKLSPVVETMGIMVSNVNHLHNLKNKLTSTYISTSQIIQRNINDEEENNN